LNTEKSNYFEKKGLILFELEKYEEALDCFLKAIDKKEDKSDAVLFEKIEFIVNIYKKQIEFLKENKFQKELNNCKIFIFFIFHF